MPFCFYCLEHVVLRNPPFDNIIDGCLPVGRRRLAKIYPHHLSSIPLILLWWNYRCVMGLLGAGLAFDFPPPKSFPIEREQCMWSPPAHRLTANDCAISVGYLLIIHWSFSFFFPDLSRLPDREREAHNGAYAPTCLSFRELMDGLASHRSIDTLRMDGQKGAKSSYYRSIWWIGTFRVFCMPIENKNCSADLLNM